jgi:CelD/BcsL family acetyltransferase involved in cellulose biosynthesis
MDPPCRPGRELELAELVGGALGSARLEFDAILLDRIVGGHAWAARLRAGFEGSDLRLVRLRREAVLPYIDLSGGYGGWLATRSANFRSELRRRRRRLEREHDLSFRRTEDPAALDRDLSTFFDLHDRRWGPRGGSGFSASMRALHLVFARSALARGWLRLWTMELEGRPAAAWYGWRCGHRYSYYQSGFDPRWADRTPGTVLLAHTIEQAAEEGATVYDLLWGDERYKDRFATGRREAAPILLVRPGLPAGAAVGLAARAREAALRLPPGAQRPLRMIAERL